MTLTRANLIVWGDVQGVGYRYFVRKVAWKNRIAGSVENLEDGTVKIICEGNENNIKNFMELINIKRPPIFVEEINVEFSEATGEFKGFRIIAGSLEEEMVEGFSTGASYFEVMFEKQDKMLEKQDTAIQILRNVNDELRSVKEDTSDMKSTLSRIEIDVKDTKFSLSSFIEEKYRKMEGEIAEIKAALARMQEAKA